MDENAQEKWRRECEARGWIKSYREKLTEGGREKADDWWKRMKHGIGEKRGQKALALLIQDMNELKNEKGGKN